MNMKRQQLKLLVAAAAAMIIGMAGGAWAKVYDLRADTTTIQLPDGTTVPAWGFADDTPGTGDGVVKVPGPTLDVPLSQFPNLVINLTNKLPVPVSVYIPGVLQPPSPVRDNSDGKGNRVRSFSLEAPAAVNGVAGPPVQFIFNGLRPGTFIYQSGTNPATQVPMGLYGALIVRPVAPGRAYDSAASAYDNEQVAVFSEIDPSFSAYVGANGTAVDVVNKVNYSLKFAPRYFLVNGRTYPDTAAPSQHLSAPPGQKTLLRMVNAGVQNHVPAIGGVPLNVIGEDGNFLPYTRAELGSILPAGKTMDALIDLTSVPPTEANFYSLVDRRGWRTSSVDGTGSMIGFVKSYPAGLDCSPFKGDMDGDGQMGVVDVLILLNKYIGNVPDAGGDVTPLSASGLPCGKGTGALELNDALYVLQKALGIN